MTVTVLFLIMTVFASASTDSPGVAVSTATLLKTGTAKPENSCDTLVKTSILSKSADSIRNTTAVSSSVKGSSVKGSKKQNSPVKKEKKVKEKRKGGFNFSRILIGISQKIPSVLHMPDELLKSILLFFKKNTIKVVLLLTFLIIIISTILFFRQKIESKRFMTTTRLSVMDKEVQRACRYIENCFDDVQLSVDKLCSEMVTGRAFLAALFERELGMTVEDFIAQVRINRAKILIKKDSSVGIDETALKTGFSDINQFKTTFEKLCGVSVDEYRKSLLTDQTV
jgi:YesN/AraC family two-component response regulator